jgi:hypothetical protein
MQQDTDILGPFQVGPIYLAESGQRAVLPEAKLHFIGIEGMRLDAELRPSPGSVGIRPELTDRLSPAIERIQILPPAGVLPAEKPSRASDGRLQLARADDQALLRRKCLADCDVPALV